MIVRPARPGDAGAVAEMAARFHALHGAPGGFSADIIRRDGFGERPWFDILLAERAGGPCGYALFHDSYETGHAAPGLYLADLWVDEAARGSGVATALLRGVAQAGRDRGAVFIWLVVQPWNAEALNFYAAREAGGESVEARALTVEALLKRG